MKLTFHSFLAKLLAVVFFVRQLAFNANGQAPDQQSPLSAETKRRLDNMLIVGPVPEKEWTYFIEDEFRSRDNPQILAENLLVYTFQGALYGRCHEGPPCQNSLFFPTNQMLLAQSVALSFAKRSRESIVKFRLLQDQLEFEIHGNLRNFSGVLLHQNVIQLEAENVTHAIFAKFSTQSDVQLRNMLTGSPAGPNGSIVDLDIIGIWLTNETQIADKARVQFALNRMDGNGDDYAVVCVNWNFLEKMWDSSRCSKGIGSNISVTFCTCDVLGIFTVLLTPIKELILNNESAIFENVGTTNKDAILKEIEGAFLAKDPKSYTKLILNAFDQNAQQAVELNITKQSVAQHLSAGMQILENVGFILLKNVKLSTKPIIVVTNLTELVAYGNVNGSHLQRFRNYSEFGQSSIRLPSDISSLAPNLTSVPAVFVQYLEIGRDLAVFSPSLPKKLMSNSEIVGASILSTTPVSLIRGNNVTITLPHLKALENNSISVCVYWDYEKNHWGTDGCTLLNTSTDTVSICSCNHLTNFATLMAFHHDYVPSSDLILNFITATGCVVSIISLILSIACFVAIRKLHSTRNTIHINLSLCLLIANVVMIISLFQDPASESEESDSDSNGPCTTLAVLLHFFYLASFMWMGIEGFHIYLMIVHVFMKPFGLYRYYLVGYGIPFVIVGSTLIAFFLSGDKIYGASKDSCWIGADNSDYVWSFLAIVIIILVLNVVLATLALRRANSRPDIQVTNPRENESNKAKIYIRQMLILHPLLGLSWALGLIQLGGVDETLNKTFSYVFTVCVSLQGFFIFYFHCLRMPEVQMVLTEYSPCKGMSAVDDSFQSRLPLKQRGPNVKNDALDKRKNRNVVS